MSLAAYWAAWRPELRRWVLLLACLAFHAHFAGPAGVLPIVGLGTATYLIGRTGRPAGCAAGIALCAGALAFYKYSAFVIDDVVGLASPDAARWLADTVGPMRPAAPPLAISFFTFEFVHYTCTTSAAARPRSGTRGSSRCSPSSGRRSWRVP